VGFRNQFTAGLAVFTLASLGCALSPSVDLLIAMRVLQGLGGAAMLSIAPAIHRTVFPNRLLGRILGLNAVLVAASTAVGPVLGGTLLAALGWEWIFLINLPLGGSGAAVVERHPGHAQAGAARPSTWPVRCGRRWPWARSSWPPIPAHALPNPARAHAALTAAAYALVALLCRCLRARPAPRTEPLLPLDIFANARFSLAALTSLASFVGQGIAFVALPFLFQNAYGYSAFESAALFTPWPLGIVLVAPHAGRLADRHSPALLSSLGLACLRSGWCCWPCCPITPRPGISAGALWYAAWASAFSRAPTTARCSAMSRANAAAMPQACWPSCAPSASAWAPRCWGDPGSPPPVPWPRVNYR
jgi:DHA2 family multidrug resistance protein-like MFS transporter